MTARIVNASLGAYGLAVAAAYLAARVIPMGRLDAAMAASLLGIPAMLGGTILAFGTVRARTGIAWVAGLATAMAIGAWIAGPPA